MKQTASNNGLRVGDPVVMTEAAAAAYPRCKRHACVVGISRDRGTVYVVGKGNKSAQAWACHYWKRDR